MGKKNTLKANKLPEEKVKLYLVAFESGDKVEHEEFKATKIEPDCESLKAWLGKEIVAEFRDWSYYVRLDEEPEEEEEYTPKPGQVNLPPDWGKLNGQKF